MELIVEQDYYLVGGVGHSGESMFKSVEGLAAIFLPVAQGPIVADDFNTYTKGGSSFGPRDMTSN